MEEQSDEWSIHVTETNRYLVKFDEELTEDEAIKAFYSSNYFSKTCIDILEEDIIQIEPANI